MKLRDYLVQHELSQSEAARILDMPLRSFQYWVAHEPPAHILRMVLECLERRLDAREFNRR